MPDAQNTVLKLTPSAEHCVWDQFNKQNLVYRLMGPI